MKGIIKFRITVRGKKPTTIMMDLEQETKATLENGAEIEFLNLEDSDQTYDVLLLKNMDAPLKKVRHVDLIPLGDSTYKRECPECKNGILLTSRDTKTGQLSAYDQCLLCGQRFEYTDINELNADLRPIID